MAGQIESCETKQSAQSIGVVLHELSFLLYFTRLLIFVVILSVENNRSSPLFELMIKTKIITHRPANLSRKKEILS